MKRMQKLFSLSGLLKSNYLLLQNAMDLIRQKSKESQNMTIYFKEKIKQLVDE